MFVPCFSFFVWNICIIDESSHEILWGVANCIPGTMLLSRYRIPLFWDFSYLGIRNISGVFHCHKMFIQLAKSESLDYIVTCYIYILVHELRSSNPFAKASIEWRNFMNRASRIFRISFNATRYSLFLLSWVWLIVKVELNFENNLLLFFNRFLFNFCIINKFKKALL